MTLPGELADAYARYRPPHSWIPDRLRAFHAGAVSRWVAHWGSKPMTVSRAPAIVFAPHPDDETFGCGGVIATKRKAGVPVEIVFLTDGRASHSHIVSKDYRWPRHLSNLRQQEALSAAKILGVPRSSVHFLDYPDGELKSLNSDRRDQLIAWLVEFLRLHQPGEVFVPHRNDRLDDHEVTYALVRHAMTEAGSMAVVLEYPVWLYWLGPAFSTSGANDLAGAFSFQVGPALPAKRRAIRIYRSQHAILPQGFTGRFMHPYEVFFQAHRGDVPRSGFRNGKRAS